MSSNQIREELHRVPFLPLTLFLPSGKTIIISNPELAMFSETGRTLVVTQGERFIYIDVPTIKAFETDAN